MIALELYDQVRDRIAADGLTPALQTRIALLLTTAKSGNLAFHGVMQWLPALGVAQQFIVSQAARELEAITLLARTTPWTWLPGVVAEAARITAPLAGAWGRVMQPPGPLFNPRAAYAGLSLGHAQYRPAEFPRSAHRGR